LDAFFVECFGSAEMADGFGGDADGIEEALF
jgi:hypothetical protein